MHRPAALSGLALHPSGLLRSVRGRLPGSRKAGKIAAIGAATVAALTGIAVFTPISHPHDLQVSGVSGHSAERIRAALEEAGRRQSTLLVDRDELMAAVEPFPEVAAVKVDSHPPFRLDLAVVMRPPVARLQIGGQSFVVAGDGTVLRRAGDASVPRIDASISGVRLSSGQVVGGRGALAVLAAAPEPLLAYGRTIRAGRTGLELVMSRGPRLIFGNANAATSKWAAAAAVLAEGDAAKATYIDLRVPARPAVGGLGGSRAAGAEDAPPVLNPVTPEAAAAAGTLGSTTQTASTSTSTADSGTSTAAPSTGSATSTGTGTETETGTATATPPTAASNQGQSAPVPSSDAPAPAAGAAAETSSGTAAPAPSSGGASLGGGTAP